MPQIKWERGNQLEHYLTLTSFRTSASKCFYAHSDRVSTKWQMPDIFSILTSFLSSIGETWLQECQFLHLEVAYHYIYPLSKYQYPSIIVHGTLLVYSPPCHPPWASFYAYIKRNLFIGHCLLPWFTFISLISYTSYIFTFLKRVFSTL